MLFGATFVLASDWGKQDVRLRIMVAENVTEPRCRTVGVRGGLHSDLLHDNTLCIPVTIDSITLRK